MQRRRLFFACSAAAVLVALSLVPACGGQTEADARSVGAAGSSAGTGGTTAKDAGKDAAKDAPKDVKDALPDYEDPGCPDAEPPVVSYECDVYGEPTGCPEGQACYPFIEYPGGPCQEELYGTMCIAAGKGGQGDPCFGGCQPHYVCVVSGQGNQCIEICDLSAPSPCSDGLVCAPLDIPGIGGCI